MNKLSVLIAAALLSSVPARAGQLADAARLNVGADRLVVGAESDRVGELLDCAKSEVQHTVFSCSLKPKALPSAFSAGHRIQNASLTVNFKGRVVNMSLAFDAGLSFETLVGDDKAAFGASPKVQYWADDKHLYASYIWIDGETEVEITRTLKGPSEGGPVRVYVSSLSGDQELSPEDAK